MSDATVARRSQLHADRWSALGEHSGITEISSMLEPGQMKRFSVFDGLKDSFLRDLSPDISVARWEEGAVLFEAGSYIDIAFMIDEGSVELVLSGEEDAAQPIFTTELTESPPSKGKDLDSERRERAKKAGGEETRITMLSTMDFDMYPGERLRLGPGEFFGEIGALNGWPQSVTARAATPCTLLQIRLPALRKLRRKQKELKKKLDETYRNRTLRSHLASTPLLEACDDDVIEELARKVELVSCQPGEEVTRQGDDVEYLILMRSGFLKLSQRVGEGDIVVSYLSKGNTLGEAELLVDGVEGWQVTASSQGYAELVKIPREHFLEITRQQPELESKLWEVAVDRIEELGFARNHLHRSDLVDFALAKGLVQGNSVLVIDLEVCVRCDDCVRGCAKTHDGIPRFVREGEKYQGFLVTRSCYHCEDPVCLIGCPTGAIRRANVGDVVEIDPSICIGCGACAGNCPYDAITMYDTGETWPDDAIPERLRGQDRQMATKCDLCYTAPQGPACVASCPHGCAFRVTTLDEFDKLVEAKLEGTLA